MRWMLFVAVLFLAAACSDPGQPSLSLALAESRWRDAAIHDYDYTISFSCGLCRLPGREVVIAVRNDVFAGASYADDGAPVDSVGLYGYVTIDGVFARLHQDLSYDPDTFRATFDRALGYPVSVLVDMHRNAADDSYGFSISAFTGNP